MNTEILIPTLANSSIRLHDIIKCKSESTWDWHVHNECELFMVIDGKKTFWVGKKEYSLNKGDIIFVNERVPHKTKMWPGTTGFLMQTGIAFNSNDINKCLFRYINHSISEVTVFESGTDINGQIRMCFEDIINENSNRRKSYDMFIKASVLKMFAVLYRNDIIKDPQSYFNAKNINRIIPVLNYIDEHYKEPISLGQMSMLLNIDKTHFCRIFKKAVNTSFVQYLNFVRVYKAERLLLTTDKTISEIAQETGFSTPAYFTETFKLNMSCTPSHYKKIKLIQKNE